MDELANCTVRYPFIGLFASSQVSYHWVSVTTPADSLSNHIVVINDPVELSYLIYPVGKLTGVDVELPSNVYLTPPRSP